MGSGLRGRSLILSPRPRRPFCLQVLRHSGQQGGPQPGTRWVLKHRGQKSWPQSREMGSRGLSRQMEQAGGSRGATGRDPSPRSNLGNGAWDLGVVCRAQGPQGSSQREPEMGKPGGAVLGKFPPRSAPFLTVQEGRMG